MQKLEWLVVEIEVAERDTAPAVLAPRLYDCLLVSVGTDDGSNHLLCEDCAPVSRAAC